MKKIQIVFEKFSKLLYSLSNVTLFFIMLLITSDVIGRVFFNQSIKGTFELTENGLVLIVFLAAAYTHYKKQHITMDFIVDNFPPKLRKTVDLLVETLTFIVLILITKEMFNQTVRVFNSGLTTSDLRIPYYLITIISTIGMFLFAIISLFRVFNNFNMLIDKNRKGDISES